MSMRTAISILFVFGFSHAVADVERDARAQTDRAVFQRLNVMVDGVNRVEALCGAAITAAQNNHLSTNPRATQTAQATDAACQSLVSPSAPSDTATIFAQPLAQYLSSRLPKRPPQLSDETQAAIRAALTGFDKGDHTGAIAQLDVIAKRPEISNSATHSSYLQRLLSETYQKQGDKARARKSASESVSLAEKAAPAEHDSEQSCGMLWRALNQYALTLPDGASLAAYKRAEKLVEKCPGEENLPSGYSQFRIASLMAIAGLLYGTAPEQSIKQYELSFQISRALAATEPQNQAWFESQAIWATMNMVQICINQKQYAKARAVALDHYGIARTFKFGVSNIHLESQFSATLAQIAAAEGMIGEAVSKIELTVADLTRNPTMIAESFFVKSFESYAVPLQGNYSNKLSLLRRIDKSVATLSALVPANVQLIRFRMNALEMIAREELLSGEPDAAVKSARHGLHVTEQLSGLVGIENSPMEAYAFSTVATALAAAKKFKEATDVEGQVIEITLSLSNSAGPNQTWAKSTRMAALSRLIQDHVELQDCKHANHFLAVFDDEFEAAHSWPMLTADQTKVIWSSWGNSRLSAFNCAKNLTDSNFLDQFDTYKSIVRNALNKANVTSSMLLVAYNLRAAAQAHLMQRKMFPLARTLADEMITLAEQLPAPSGLVIGENFELLTALKFGGEVASKQNDKKSALAYYQRADQLLDRFAKSTMDLSWIRYEKVSLKMTIGNLQDVNLAVGSQLQAFQMGMDTAFPIDAQSAANGNISAMWQNAFWSGINACNQFRATQNLIVLQQWLPKLEQFAGDVGTAAPDQLWARRLLPYAVQQRAFYLDASGNQAAALSAMQNAVQLASLLPGDQSMPVTDDLRQIQLDLAWLHERMNHPKEAAAIYVSSAITAIKLAETSGTNANFAAQAAFAYRNAGVQLAKQGDRTAAGVQLENARATAYAHIKKSSDSEQITALLFQQYATLNEIAKNQNALKRTEAAIADYLELRELIAKHPQTPWPEDPCYATYELAKTYQQNGQEDKAFSLFTSLQAHDFSALSAAQKDCHLLAMLQASDSVGSTEKRLTIARAAERLAQSVLESSSDVDQTTNLQRRMHWAVGNQAEDYALKGDYALAFQASQKSITVSKALNDTNLEQSGYREQCLIAVIAQDLSKVFACRASDQLRVGTDFDFLSGAGIENLDSITALLGIMFSCSSNSDVFICPRLRQMWESGNRSELGTKFTPQTWLKMIDGKADTTVIQSWILILSGNPRYAAYVLGHLDQTTIGANVAIVGLTKSLIGVAMGNPQQLPNDLVGYLTSDAGSHEIPTIYRPVFYLLTAQMLETTKQWGLLIELERQWQGSKFWQLQGVITKIKSNQRTAFAYHNLGQYDQAVVFYNATVALSNLLPNEVGNGQGANALHFYSLINLANLKAAEPNLDSATALRCKAHAVVSELALNPRMKWAEEERRKLEPMLSSHGLDLCEAN